MRIIWWYYQIRPKVLWKVHGARIDEYHSQNKDKSITIMKNKSLLFFRAVYHSKKHVIPHPIIAAILDVNNNMPVQFFKYNRKLSENSY